VEAEKDSRALKWGGGVVNWGIADCAPGNPYVRLMVNRPTSSYLIKFVVTEFTIISASVHD
jgi:hypothetical protein